MPSTGLDVITGRDPITVDYAPGSVQMVEQRDGTQLALRKIDADYDPHDRLGAMTLPAEARGKGPDRHRAALVDPDSEDLHTHLNTVDDALEHARCRAALSRLRGAGQNQRQPALIRSTKRPQRYRAN